MIALCRGYRRDRSGSLGGKEIGRELGFVAAATCNTGQFYNSRIPQVSHIKLT